MLTSAKERATRKKASDNCFMKKQNKKKKNLNTGLQKD